MVNIECFFPKYFTVKMCPNKTVCTSCKYFHGERHKSKEGLDFTPENEHTFSTYFFYKPLLDVATMEERIISTRLIIDIKRKWIINTQIWTRNTVSSKNRNMVLLENEITLNSMMEEILNEDHKKVKGKTPKYHILSYDGEWWKYDTQGY